MHLRAFSELEIDELHFFLGGDYGQMVSHHTWFQVIVQQRALAPSDAGLPFGCSSLHPEI